MNDLLPNMDLLKSPMNWFLVAFAVILLAFIAHVFVKKGTE